MATKKLEMIFKNQSDSKTKLSLDSPREDLTDAEVNTVMSDIITNNIFNSSGGDFTAISGARVITTDVQDLNV